MLEQLRSKLEFIRVDDEVLRGKVAETKDVRTLALAGSGLAGLGVIIAALSPILWLDITGGIFLGDRHSSGRGRTALAPIQCLARFQAEAGRFSSGVS